MGKKYNKEIRDFVEDHNLFMYEVPKVMGISEATFTKRMRSEWSPEEKKRVLSLLEEYVRSKKNG